MASKIAAKNILRKVASSNRPLLFGMVHLRALPGAPRAEFNLNEISEIAIREARTLASSGCDGILVENMHDLPYMRPEELADDGGSTVACMTLICDIVKRACNSINPNLIYGVQVLAGCNRQAMSIAAANEFDFIRAEAYAYAHVADEGFLQSSAAAVTRQRRMMQATNVGIIADTTSMHSSHSITADLSLVETAQGAIFCGADGVVLTGAHTGQAASPQQLNELRDILPDVPVWIGSGVTAENVHLYQRAQALIVGSELKADGQWHKHIDEVRLARMIDAWRSIGNNC